MSNAAKAARLEELASRLENGECSPEEFQEALADYCMGIEGIKLGEAEEGLSEQEAEDPSPDEEEPAEEPAREESGPAPARGRKQAIEKYRQGSGPDDELVNGYLSAYSQFHILRSASQSSMVCTLLRTLVPAMARKMCTEAGVEGVSAMLLAEQAAESRVDEAFARALAGKELEEMHIGKAERLVRIADKHSRRMMTAIEKLHRLKRPRVNVKISGANNVNLGQQVVNRSDGGEGAVVDAPPG